MTLESIDRIVRSTLQILMCDPDTYAPRSNGSACIVVYNGRYVLLTVAHLTDKSLATCVDKGLDPVNGHTELYSIGAMQYFYSFDVTKLDEQIASIDVPYDHPEEKDFGRIDLAMALIKPELKFSQREYKFPYFTIAKGTKSYILASFQEQPSAETTYAFFGHRKEEYFPGPRGDKYLETQPFFCDGLKFIRQINNHYEFELTKEIQDHREFIGTSGAPIMDTAGNLISLVTHGNRGSKKIFGLALKNFKTAIDAFLFTELGETEDSLFPPVQ